MIEMLNIADFSPNYLKKIRMSNMVLILKTKKSKESSFALSFNLVVYLLDILLPGGHSAHTHTGGSVQKIFM